MSRWQRQASGGFTVLEVLIAAFILVFAVASTASLFLAAMTQGTVGKRASDAAALAQRELEAIRDLPFDAVGRTANCPPPPCVPAGTTVNTQTVGAHAYTVERVVTVDDPAPNMTRIRITVTWDIRGPRSYVAETIFTNLTR
jgi:Tfp pilus assembly protein PilV